MNIIEAFAVKNDCYKANVGRVDSRYRTFQDRGPLGLMLHSVGCAQPSGKVFADLWNKPNYSVCPHGCIDADTGDVYQTLPWNYRGWHGGKAESNNTMIGVEMGESRYIRYTGKGAEFTVLDLDEARKDCACAYDAAVELFAYLCAKYGLNPLSSICSHREGGTRGIASNHIDPEHYWIGLGMPYTMDTFRAAVKAKLDGKPDEDVMYRIQLGAYTRKDYAEAYLEKVQQTYPEAYIVKGKR
jgi:hypothetical protein